MRHLPAVAVLAFVAAWRLFLTDGLDLSDAPGPAGAQLLVLAVLGQGPGWDGWILHRVLSWTGGDPVQVARGTMQAASLLGVVGLMLGAHALGGWRAAVGAGIVGGLWSMQVLLSLLVGADALTGGLVFFGVGLAWSAPRARAAGVPLAFLGALLAVLAVGLKITTLPVLVFLALVPFLGCQGPGWNLAHAGATLAGAWAGRAWLLSHLRLPVTSPDALQPSLAGLQAGWEAILQFQTFHGFDGVFPLLTGMAVIGVILPGHRFRDRILLGLLAAVVLGQASAALGAQVRPRYLVFAAWGIQVLAGVAIGNASFWIAGLASRHPSVAPRILAWLPAAALATWLALDSLAFLHAFSAGREAHAGTAPATLPRPPTALLQRYERVSFDNALSVAGAADLVRIPQEVRRPMAGFHLPDRREAHLELGALLAGQPTAILKPDACCSGLPTETCALQTVDALDRAGAVLLLPTPRDDQGEDPASTRIDVRDRAWVAAVRAAAAARGPLTQPSPWWDAWSGAGSGAPLPCASAGIRQR